MLAVIQLLGEYALTYIRSTVNISITIVHVHQLWSPFTLRAGLNDAIITKLFNARKKWKYRTEEQVRSIVKVKNYQVWY